MISTLLTILGVILLVCCVQLIVGPVLVYSRNRQQVHPTFHEFNPQQPPMQLPQDYFDNIEEMKRLGFALISHLYQDNQTPGVHSCITLFTNRNEFTGAIVVYMCTENLAPLSYVEFSTEFDDGSEINTNNIENPGVFANIPAKLEYAVPHVKKVMDLYHIHQGLLLANSKTSRRKLPVPGQEVNDLCTGMSRDLERQADRGYFRPDPTTDKYRPTIKGALLMTWKLAWPVGQIRKHLRYLNGKRIVGDLGIVFSHGDKTI